MSIVIASNPLDQLNLKRQNDIVFPNVFRRMLGLKQQPEVAKYDDLLNRVKLERCEASFRELFDYFYPRVLSYFERGGVAGQKSSDLAQETLVMVWHKASYFELSKGSSNTWIFTIARNVKYDYFRSLGRDVLGVASDDIFDRIDDPAFQMNPHLFSGDIREKIDALPLDQREAVYATYFEGYSHGEYAELKKIPLGTVKSRIRLALAQLKKGLEDL